MFTCLWSPHAHRSGIKRLTLWSSPARACVGGRTPNVTVFVHCSPFECACARTARHTHARTDGRTLLNMHAVCSVGTPMRQCGLLALRTLLYPVNSTRANTQYDISARVAPTSEARPPVVASKPGCCNAAVFVCVCVRFLNDCRRSLLEWGGSPHIFMLTHTLTHAHRLGCGAENTLSRLL